MGVLKRFEQRLEGLVNGTFAKVFKSEVQPVEIAGALQRECDNNATIWNRDRTVVPNDFIVELSTPDFERLSPYAVQLGDELAGMVRDYAKQQRYTFMGSIKVHLEKADDLDTGLYRVRSRTLASSASQEPRGPGGRPARRLGAPRQHSPAARPRRSPPPACLGPAVPAAHSPYRRTAPVPGCRTAARTHGPGAGSRSTATATRSPGRPSCWAAAPRRTYGSTTPASPGGTARSGSERPPWSRTWDPRTASWWTGSTPQRATLRDGSRIVVGSTTIVYRQAEG